MLFLIQLNSLRHLNIQRLLPYVKVDINTISIITVQLIALISIINNITERNTKNNNEIH